MTDAIHDALERLDAEGLDALADPDLRELVRRTPELRARVAALREIDAELAMLADIAPPPAALARAIEAVEAERAVASPAPTAAPDPTPDDLPEPGFGAALRAALGMVARGLLALLSELPKMVWRGLRGAWRALGRARVPLAAGALLASAAIAAFAIVGTRGMESGGDTSTANVDDADRLAVMYEEAELEDGVFAPPVDVAPAATEGEGGRVQNGPAPQSPPRPTSGTTAAPPEEPMPAPEAYRGDGPGRVHGVGSIDASNGRGAGASLGDRGQRVREPVVEIGRPTLQGGEQSEVERGERNRRAQPSQSTFDVADEERNAAYPSFDGPLVDELTAPELGRAMNSSIGASGALRDVFGNEDAFSNNYGTDFATDGDGDAFVLGRGVGGMGVRGTGRGGGGTGLAMADTPEQTIVLEVPEIAEEEQEYRGGQGQQGYGDFEARLERRDDNGIDAYRQSALEQSLGNDLALSPPMAFETGAAAEFLAERRRIEGLRFRRADGYWANTYVPGDPARAAALQTLEQIDAPLARALAESARPMERPFDAPTDAAMAVYLHADRRSAQGPTRVLLQVGIQGTEREGARRPAMTGCVVLDLTDTPTTEQAASMRALLESLARGQEIGDRFCVVVAGRDGGVVVAPGELTYGTATVLAGQYLGDAAVAAGGYDLRSATALALETVREATGEDATLGAGLVWLVTARLPGDDTAALEQIAHVGAVDGIATSVVGVGELGVSEALASIARAGQGTRRVLADAAGAEDVVEAELLAAGDVVARAARLRIRLAPGVRLVDVVGSYRLDDEQAQRVRDAEQSADARLSAQLGIEADRGEDEDGIQIVIPAFHAGDSHVILLDVVVPGAGPVADVTIRYKDLLWMRNGVTRASYALTSSPVEPGALEQTVLASLVDREVSTALADASASVSARSPERAVARIEEALALVRGLASLEDAPVSPVALQADARLLAAYVELIAQRSPDPTAIAASMRWAAYRKLLLPTESP